MLTVALLALSWVVPAWRLAPLVEMGSVVPLHYNIYFGVDLVGNWRLVYFLPGFATVVFIVNSIVAFKERNESKVLSDMLSVTYFAVAMFVVVAMFFVLLINV